MAQEIKKLIQGYKDFQNHYFEHNYALFSKLSQEGQRPKILVIACSDSRVDPAIVTNCRPGDLFVVRNVANLVPPYEQDHGYHGTSAALEFAVCTLGVRHIIVFGHTQCGGIAHLLQHPEEREGSTFVSKWMHLAATAYAKTLQENTEGSFEEKVARCSQHSLTDSLQNLQTFPWIADRVKKKELFLHGWQFNIATGGILTFDAVTKTFRELSELK